MVKTVAAFLNTNGGAPAIGVRDNGKILGIQPQFDLKKPKALHARTGSSPSGSR